MAEDIIGDTVWSKMNKVKHVGSALRFLGHPGMVVVAMVGDDDADGDGSGYCTV